MAFELSEEQRAFQATARDFAAAELAPHAAAWDQAPLRILVASHNSGGELDE